MVVNEYGESPGLDRGFCRWVTDDPSARLYFRPLPLAVPGMIPDAGVGPDRDVMRLAGGWVWFHLIEVIVRPASDGGVDNAREQRAVGNRQAVLDWAVSVGREAEVRRRLELLEAPRRDFAGLSLDRPRVMGIVNVTPDSFSDGGDFQDRKTAIDHGRRLVDQGCDILDIGGESTRPGAAPVSLAEELDRVIPVIEALAPLGAPISVDTMHATVMRAAIDVGARIINDVSALSADPDSYRTAAAAGETVPIVLMHMLGEPGTMQKDPRYENAPLDILDRLSELARLAVDKGIHAERLTLDPGIGFGKTVAHNVDIMRHLSMLHMTGHPVLLGASRKRFLGTLAGVASPKDRMAASLVAGIAAVQHGAQMIRVHDGAETVQALRVFRALAG